MNKNQEFNPSQESEFEVMLSEGDYERLKNSNNLYKDALEANRILTEEFVKFKRRTLDRDREVEQLIRRAFLMGKRVIELDQALTINSQRCQKLKIELDSVLIQNRELKQEVSKINEIESKKRLALQQTKGGKQTPSIDFEEFREKASKYQELKREYQEAISRLGKQLQTQISARQEMIQNYKTSCEQKRHYSDFITRLSVQITRINLMIQTTQQEQEKRQEIDVQNKIEQSKSIQNKIEQSKSTYNESQQSQKINGVQSIQNGKRKIKEQMQQMEQRIMMSQSSEMQFIEKSLITIASALSSHSSLLKQFKQLQQLNRHLHLGKTQQALRKRIQALQVYCSNLKVKLTSQLNIATLIQTKYDQMKTTLVNNELVQNAIEDLVSNYRQAIDHEYAKIVQKLINE